MPAQFPRGLPPPDSWCRSPWDKYRICAHGSLPNALNPPWEIALQSDAACSTFAAMSPSMPRPRKPTYP